MPTKTPDTPATADVSALSVPVNIVANLFAKGALPFLYEELGTFDLGERGTMKVAIHAAHHALYFFVPTPGQGPRAGSRIVAIPVIKLCETLAPKVIEIVDTDGKPSRPASPESRALEELMNAVEDLKDFGGDGGTEAEDRVTKALERARNLIDS